MPQGRWFLFSAGDFNFPLLICICLLITILNVFFSTYVHKCCWWRNHLRYRNEQLSCQRLHEVHTCPAVMTPLLHLHSLSPFRPILLGSAFFSWALEKTRACICACVGGGSKWSQRQRDREGEAGRGEGREREIEILRNKWDEAQRLVRAVIALKVHTCLTET